MATLHARNVSEQLYGALRARAEQNGRSIGAEAIAILGEALRGSGSPPGTSGYAPLRAGGFGLRRRSGAREEFLGRFTTRGRHVLVAAQEEARALGHGYLGTEHLLLAALRVLDSPATKTLALSGLEPDPLRVEVERIVGRGEGDSEPGPMPFTKRAKKALELALREALAVGLQRIEPEHVLIALGGEGEGVAARLLADRGIDAATLRGLVITGPSVQLAAGADRRSEEEFRVLELEGSAQAWEAALNEVAAEGYELVQIVEARAILRLA